MKIPRFATIFNRLSFLERASYKTKEGYQRLIDGRLRKQTTKPKGRKPKKVLTDIQLRSKNKELYQSLYNDILPRYQVAMERLVKRENKLKEKLVWLAKRQNVPVTETESKVFQICSWDYHTQGFGCTTYARGAAQREIDGLNANGIPCRLVETPDGICHTMTNYIFEVFANCDKAGYKQSNLKPLDLVERVRLSWKRGVNPRVDAPFLPHNFEEKHGLDYFGNKIK